MNLASGPVRLVLSLACAAMLARSRCASAADWPQFLGPDRNGIYPGKELAATWPAGGPPTLWKADVGQGFAAPVVSDGKLVLFHRLADREVVDCLDAMSGKPLWRGQYPTDYRDDFGFDEGPRATPTIADAKVYTFGAQGMLNCWDLQNGKDLWHVDARRELSAPKGFFGLACSPLVEGNCVILNVGSRVAGIVAFDKSSGKLLWKATDDAASYSSPMAATIHGKRYVLVFDRTALVALEPASGKVFFRFPWHPRSRESVSAATPLVIDDLVFISASYGAGATLLRFNESGPQRIWSGDNILSNHYATSVYHDGFLYGFDGRQETGPNLRCVEFKTGKVRWSQDNFGGGTLMLAGDRLLVLTEKGELIMAPATPQHFQPVARAQILGFECRAYPALANGLYYARDKQKLVCVDLRARG